MSNPLVLFGAGERGRWSLDHTQDMNIEIECFVDADPTLWGTNYKGKEIYSPEHLRNLNHPEVLITCYPVHKMKICDLLAPLGFEYGRNLHLTVDKMNYTNFLSKNFNKFERIRRGGSGCHKYHASSLHREYFLHLSDISQYKRGILQYEFLKRAIECGVSVSHPVSLSKIDAWGSCMQFDWIEGSDLLDVILQLPERTQYNLGVEAGQTLRRIHDIQSSPVYNECIDRPYIKAERSHEYLHSKIPISNNEKNMIDYIRSSKEVHNNQHLQILHGDFHLGNLMIKGQNLVVVDFDGFRYGSRMNDFSRTTWSGIICPYFATGQVHGYLGGVPSIEFWEHVAHYTILDAINVYLDFATIGTTEMLEKRKKRNHDILLQFNNLRSIVPNWYTNTMPK